jgi:hypothetical protein
VVDSTDLWSHFKERLPANDQGGDPLPLLRSG